MFFAVVMMAIMLDSRTDASVEEVVDDQEY